MAENKAAETPVPKRPAGPFGRGPMGGAMGAGEKPKNFKATMKNLLQYSRPFWLSIVIVFVFAIASTTFAILSPKILGRATNQIASDFISMKAYDQIVGSLPKGTVIPPGTTGADFVNKMPASTTSKIPASIIDKIKALDLSHRPGIDFNKIRQIAMLLIGLYILSALFSYIQGWIMTNVSQKITYQFRRDISEKINRMPLKYLTDVLTEKF